MSATPGGILGALASQPNAVYRIQLFSSAAGSINCVPVTSPLQPSFVADPQCANSTGAPSFLAIQGETLIGEFYVTTDANGLAQFFVTVQSQRIVAATATRIGDDSQPRFTSELSQAVRTGAYLRPPNAACPPPVKILDEPSRACERDPIWTFTAPQSLVR